MTEAVKLRRPEEEMLRWLLRRADALNAAYMAVELEEWGYPEMKAENAGDPGGKQPVLLISAPGVWK